VLGGVIFNQSWFKEAAHHLFFISSTPYAFVLQISIFQSTDQTQG
jgi:hypothetical protein